MVAAPPAAFDLSPLREQARRDNAPAARFLLLCGAAFVAGGAALGAGIATQTPGIPFWQPVAVVTGAASVAALLFWVPVLAARPWRWPRTLRVSDEGFAIEYSTGAVEKHDWSEPGLAISVREPLALGGTPSVGPTGEYFQVAPGESTGFLDRAAREALLGAAARRGLATLQESYETGGATRRAPPVPVTERVVVHESFGVVPPTRAWRAPEPPDPAGGFDLVRGSLTPDAITFTGVPKRIGTVSISDSGIEVRKVGGPVVRYDWSSPRLRLRLLRRLESAATPLSAPDAMWGLELGAPRLNGEVSGVCYGAIVAKARARGLACRTARFCLPDRPSSRWLASTTIRPAAASR